MLHRHRPEHQKPVLLNSVANLTKFKRCLSLTFRQERVQSNNFNHFSKPGSKHFNSSKQLLACLAQKRSVLQ